MLGRFSESLTCGFGSSGLVRCLRAYEVQGPSVAQRCRRDLSAKGCTWPLQRAPSLGDPAEGSS